MNDQSLIKHAADAYEAIRALNHGTYRTIPAPLAYSLLGNLRSLGVALSQLADQIDAGLRSSLTTHDVYDDNRDPAASVELADEALNKAADHANDMAWLFGRAQEAIAWQGYRTDNDDDEEGQR
ncbi:hypothetical protein EV644_10386 [Kribbella orskensis]|uniref:Excreted virulence factor EspC (Type VII ESX diderm) n=1 Tax=Kribbella orskensis TaxID=2512216 RepID=A0ABY2BPP6_9ACTN|nr:MULTISPECIES: hypothetical protein [Kribbella]TCN39828.1 hypothetical protein EV642_106334 [Kribbella sp. VKM Ac-2500]TCO27389.1 hypothetical protein EV644_10386 [Kribbella orskensis]